MSKAHISHHTIGNFDSQLLKNPNSTPQKISAIFKKSNFSKFGTYYFLVTKRINNLKEKMQLKRSQITQYILYTIGNIPSQGKCGYWENYQHTILNHGKQVINEKN